MKEEIIFREGMKPLWQRVIAAVLYSIALYFIVLLFVNKPIAFSNIYVRSFVDSFEFIIFLISAALPLSLTRNHYFDFDNKKYKLEYTIGYLKYGKWSLLPELEYVSVFQKEEGVFEVNLWYVKNNHFNIYSYFDYNDAIKMGFIIANKLEIDLLDASSHHDFKWIDKEVYNENGKVKYL